MTAMKLGTYLDQQGLSLTAFARSLGEKITTVHGWTNGRRKPGLVKMLAVQRATNGSVQPIDFLPETQESDTDQTSKAA
jgi:DNA-binding transcriptional regulator YdaS (Cro superfamily)